MPTAEAHVQTSQPGRYLIQLCRHAQQIHRLPHSPRPHDRGGARPAPTVQHVEWSQTRGMISFGWGQCTMQASPDRLTLQVEAADEEHLQRVQEIIAADIERFGRRDQLKVTW
jgi:hypothetical protein